jgi:hypothetical protein
MIELSSWNTRMYDGIPGNVVDELIKEEKITGEFYRLEKKNVNFNKINQSSIITIGVPFWSAKML